MFQLTGVIRNLVNDVDTQRRLVGMGGVSQVSRCLKLFMTDLDVVCNIARTVSVMSSDDEACAAIAEDPDFTSTAVSVLNKYPGRQDIVVRLTYCEYNIQYCGTCLQKIFKVKALAFKVCLNDEFLKNIFKSLKQLP